MYFYRFECKWIEPMQTCFFGTLFVCLNILRHFKWLAIIIRWELHFQTTNNNLFGNSWLYESDDKLSCHHDCEQPPDEIDCPPDREQGVEEMCTSLLDPNGRFKVISILVYKCNGLPNWIVLTDLFFVSRILLLFNNDLF